MTTKHTLKTTVSISPSPSYPSDTKADDTKASSTEADNTKEIGQQQQDQENIAHNKRGIILVILSATLFSMAGIFTKTIQAETWSIIAWRGIFAAILLFIWIIYKRNFIHSFLRMGTSGIAVAIIGALGTAAFLSAFKLTSVANVSLIYAAAPLLAAIIAWIWLKEKITRPVAWGCFGAISGVLIVVSGSLGNLNQGNLKQGSLNLEGDLLALGMTFSLALIMVIYRRYPSTPSAGPTALSALLLIPVCFYMGNPQDIALSEILPLALFGLLFSIAAISLTEGAKLIASGRAALLSSLETPIAPLLAWLILYELPTLQAIIGGIVIMIAVIYSQRTHCP
ncbi:DMT family transporter [Kiloniella majae]|uniref:DMT family transporter n=1 Tax=Kiloniella majae TaxID=1938558 RepID=UPI000A2790F3|nr:DMT family transporter [Kiloniella majae]